MLMSIDKKINRLIELKEKTYEGLTITEAWEILSLDDEIGEIVREIEKNGLDF
jgi:hypothetical protein